MSAPNSGTASDPTFRSYSSTQATSYARHRRVSLSPIHSFVLDHHKFTGGNNGTLLDVGCGPGNVTNVLAQSFETAMGVDPGSEMINVARHSDGKTSTEAPVQYYVCAAEELDQVKEISHGSVDLITAAMAAHWFDMPKFWAAAAKVLKPGGSVALWTHSSYYCHPSTPNAKKVQAILSELEDVTLGPHVLPPNKLSRDMYANLVLPWASEETSALFEKDTFLRRTWDDNGELTNGQDFFSGSNETSLSDMEQGLGTASMVTRWREAHPEEAGTDRDCVRVAMDKVRQALGVERGQEAQTKIKMGMGTALLFITRKA